MTMDPGDKKKHHTLAVGARGSQDGLSGQRETSSLTRKHVRFLKHVWVYDVEDKWYYDRTRVEYDESSRGCVVDWQCPVTRKNTNHNQNITEFQRGSLERYILVKYEVTSEQAIKVAANHNFAKTNTSLTVKNLPLTMTQGDVMRIFSKSGKEIDQVKMLHTEEGLKMGTIELHVSTSDTAYDIRNTFDGKELYGHVIRVMLIGNQCISNCDHKVKKTSAANDHKENPADLRCQISKPRTVTEEMNVKRPIWNVVDKKKFRVAKKLYAKIKKWLFRNGVKVFPPIPE